MFPDKNYDETDEFAYRIIYQKEFGDNTPKKLMKLWRDGFDVLTVRQSGTGELLAMGMIEKDNKGTIKLEHIAVEPDYRKYRLGSLVVGYLVDMAELRGVQEVRLRSVENAVGFYEKNGFEEIDKSLHVMSRRLAS